MRLRPLFIVSTAAAFALLAACEIHTGDGTQPAAPATPTTVAAPPATTVATPANETPLEKEHLATGHVILRTDGGT